MKPYTRRLRDVSLSLMALLGCFGCGTEIEYIPMNSPPRRMAPRAPESIQIFTASRPSQKFVEVVSSSNKLVGSFNPYGGTATTLQGYLATCIVYEHEAASSGVVSEGPPAASGP